MHVIDTVARKLQNGQRLSEADALALYESPELLAMGELADDINRTKNNETVYFNVNRHINPTNICALSCKFCAYSRKPGEEGGYAYSIEEMIKKAGEAVQQGATEVHMVGGLHPRWKYDYYKEMISEVKKAYPHLHLKAFTAVELDWLARKARKTIPEILAELREVGLGSLPGGGAEIFHPEIRDAICDTKVSAEQWLDTHRQAHRLGMMSNCTMLYGHIERYEHRVDHMRRLRDLQDETHGFNAFIPLSFQPFQNEMGIDQYTFGYDDLKTIAVARLFLDNFKHIKAYWVMLGQDIAQLGLEFGANDLDGTVLEEKISRMAGGRAGMAMPRSFIEELVRKSRRTPCERDTLYAPIVRDEEQRSELAIDRRIERSQERAHIEADIAAAKRGEDLNRDQLLNLAKHASTQTLGQLARTQVAHRLRQQASLAPAVVLRFAELLSVSDAIQKVATAIAAGQQRHHGLGPCILAIDLAINPAASATASSAVSPPRSTAESINFDYLLELLTALKQSYASYDISLRGLKALWQLAQTEDVQLVQICRRLQEAGIDLIESSPDESETDLTHSEIVSLHRAIHKAEIPTSAKLELDAPALGVFAKGKLSSTDTVNWDGYLRRLATLNQLAADTGQLLSVHIEAAKGSFVTALEYMRAVALARLAAPQIPHIIAPLDRMPVLSPAKGLGSYGYQHPAEKIAAICLHFGADDLGTLDADKLSMVQIMQQIRSAGFQAQLRDSRFHDQKMPAALISAISKPRHMPPLNEVAAGLAFEGSFQVFAGTDANPEDEDALIQEQILTMTAHLSADVR